LTSIQDGRVLKAVVLTMVCVARLFAQSPEAARRPAARLIGIYDSRTGEPLTGVQVIDAFSGTYSLTTSTGTAPLSFLTFRGVAAFVDLRKLGYQAKQIIVSRDDTVPITEVMDPVAELAPVVTTEQYRIERDAGKWDGFETRCQSKSVTCFRREDLEKKVAANLADLLVHADGVTIGTCGGGSGFGRANRNGQCGKIAMRSTVIPPTYCQPTFFVDGFEWKTTGQLGAPSDLTPGRPAEAPYTPANVKAIEVYPPERQRPLRFQGASSACGVVVIWTK
jgi:hypothetical protein